MLRSDRLSREIKDWTVRIGCLLLLLAASECSLKAYADPGSGALIWQVLVAAAIGVLYYIRRIAAFFRKKNRND